MYEYLTLKEVQQQQNLNNYKLCYVTSVDKEIWDYTPESKEFMKNDQQYLEYERQIKEKFEKDMKEFGHAHFEQNPLSYRIRGQFYPNPELEKGTYIAYFTSIPLEKQWGDDWDDAPYEHNAEIPYDDHYDENHNRKEHTIKCVYFTPKTNITLPEDYGFGGNSPFCVENINKGAIAWIFDGTTGIYAGYSLEQFIKLFS